MSRPARKGATSGRNAPDTPRRGRKGRQPPPQPPEGDTAAPTPKRQEVQTHKKAVLEALSSGIVSGAEAAKRIGKDPATVWRWRQADPEFDAAFIAARTASDAIRVGMVEDSVFARIVKGTASPAETIFFLKNRAPDRWRDRVEHTGSDGGPISFTLDIRTPLRISEDEDRRLGAGG